MLLALEERDSPIGPRERQDFERRRRRFRASLGAPKRLPNRRFARPGDVGSASNRLLVSLAPVERSGGSFGDVGLHGTLHAPADAQRVGIGGVGEVKEEQNDDDRDRDEWPSSAEDVQRTEDDGAEDLAPRRFIATAAAPGARQ